MSRRWEGPGARRVAGLGRRLHPGARIWASTISHSFIMDVYGVRRGVGRLCLLWAQTGLGRSPGARKVPRCAGSWQLASGKRPLWWLLPLLLRIHCDCDHYRYDNEAICWPLLCVLVLPIRTRTERALPGFRQLGASWLYCCLLITALMLGCHGHVLALSNGPVVSFATGASWQELLPSSFPRRQAPTRSARHQAGATRRGSSFRMLLVSAQLEGATDQRAINAESAQ